MSVTVIRAADCPEMPWKNGGGTTREIAVFPPGAGMDDFLWRLSMARVETAGLFSTFPEVERVLGIIEGRLALQGPEVDVTLDSFSAPLLFDAARSVKGTPLQGPVLDLNAMVRCADYSVSMTRLDAGNVVECTVAGFVVALKGQICAKIWLNELDCLAGPFSAHLEGPVFVVQFQDTGGVPDACALNN